MPQGEAIKSLTRDWNSVQDATHAGSHFSIRQEEDMTSTLELEAVRHSYVNVSDHSGP
jgi:hypothetical protein